MLIAVSPCCLLDRSGPRAQYIKVAGANRRQRADGCECHEYALPTKRHGYLRNTVAGEGAAQIADPVDYSGCKRAALFAAEVQGKRAAQVGIGPEEAESDCPDRKQRQQLCAVSGRYGHEAQQRCGCRAEPCKHQQRPPVHAETVTEPTHDEDRNDTTAGKIALSPAASPALYPR